MLCLQKILTLLALLFAATVAAAPAEANKGINPYRKAYPGEPWASCDVKDRFVYDSYVLQGRNWNVTQDQVRDSVKAHGRSVTDWKWFSDVRSGQQVFEAKVSFPFPPGLLFETARLLFSSLSHANHHLVTVVPAANWPGGRHWQECGEACQAVATQAQVLQASRSRCQRPLRHQQSWAS